MRGVSLKRKLDDDDDDDVWWQVTKSVMTGHSSQVTDEDIMKSLSESLGPEISGVYVCVYYSPQSPFRGASWAHGTCA